MNKLEQLSTMTKVVADTGDINSIKRFKPVDATTNPSLLLSAAKIPEYAPLLDDAIRWGGANDLSSDEQSTRSLEKLSVSVGCEVLKHVPGRVSTEVSAQFSFDQHAVVESARRLIELYDQAGIGADRVLIKTAATWDGIKAAEMLEREGIQCNLTLLFGFGQAQACADAGVHLISPFVGRIWDWYRANTDLGDVLPENDPGVRSVTKIFNHYKDNGYETIVMGASFRHIGQVTALSGCDQLTISPGLLNELEADSGVLERQLAANKTATSNVPEKLSESGFLWQLNEDAMASDKLAEGIRNFYADEQKLAHYLAEYGASGQSENRRAS